MREILVGAFNFAESKKLSQIKGGGGKRQSAIQTPCCGECPRYYRLIFVFVFKSFVAFVLWPAVERAKGEAVLGLRFL
jgi:hypothetical protein